MWLEATRVRIAPGSAVSRSTLSPVITAASDRVVGIPSAAMAELRHEMAKLVAGVGHCDRVGAIGKPFSGEDLGSLRAREPIRIEAEVYRQPPVELDQARRGDRRWCDARKKIRRQRRVGI